QPGLHLPHRSEQPRVVRRDFDRFNEAVLARELAKFSADEPVNQPRKPNGLRRLDALHVSHTAPPPLSFLCGRASLIACSSGGATIQLLSIPQVPRRGTARLSLIQACFLFRPNIPTHLLGRPTFAPATGKGRDEMHRLAMAFYAAFDEVRRSCNG